MKREGGRGVLVSKSLTLSRRLRGKAELSLEDVGVSFEDFPTLKIKKKIGAILDDEHDARNSGHPGIYKAALQLVNVSGGFSRS